MIADMREKGRRALDSVPEAHLNTVVRWLELLALRGNQPDVEPEELWLLASGQLEQMADEAEKDAQPLNDWRKYLNDL